MYPEYRRGGEGLSVSIGDSRRWAIEAIQSV
jgi:hypothetical protein